MIPMPRILILTVSLKLTGKFGMKNKKPLGKKIGRIH